MKNIDLFGNERLNVYMPVIQTLYMLFTQPVACVHFKYSDNNYAWSKKIVYKYMQEKTHYRQVSETHSNVCRSHKNPTQPIPVYERSEKKFITMTQHIKLTLVELSALSHVDWFQLVHCLNEHRCLKSQLHIKTKRLNFAFLSLGCLSLAYFSWGKFFDSQLFISPYTEKIWIFFLFLERE